MAVVESRGTVRQHHYMSGTAVGILFSLALAPLPALAQSLPTGGTVTSGSAAIAQPSSSNLLITQTSKNAILSWESFSVGAGASTHFENGSGATLNRVTGTLPSAIDGSLSATGSLYLINPAGVAVGTGGMVRTGGSFVASSHDVTDTDFLDGGDLTLKGDSKAQIVNRGFITSLSGDVVLTARRVENSGTIEAPEGSVGLLGGYEVLLRDTSLADGKFSVMIGGSDTEVVNTGTVRAAEVEIRANGGRVEALAGNTRTVVKATGVKRTGGRIFLTAGSDGTVRVTQRVVARRAATQAARRVVAELPEAGPLPTHRPDVQFAGGEVHIQARVADLGGTIDASGSSLSGGNIAVSGDLISNTGVLTAAGASGGDVSFTARSILSAGTVDVSGQEGNGGTFDATASGSYIETASGNILAGGASGGGLISIDASRIFSSGTLSVYGAAGIGGRIDLAADDIDLVAASLTADGQFGGGHMRIGGDFQGGGSFRHASETSISPATTLSANALLSGNGGGIVVWSDQSTEFFGTASARAGLISGDGGTVELSSGGELVMGGHAQAGAPNGANGQLLLDPKNIVIDDATGKYPQYQLIDPNPNAGNQFGASVVSLSTGNVVVRSANDDTGATDAGAVYLYNETTGALISTLVGSTPNDHVGSGGITVLSNGNYVVRSDGWATAAGAVTWGSGVSGTSGGVSATNSLVGTKAYDEVGSGGITELSNGNYVVNSYNWGNGSATNAGAVTWGDGTTGTKGAVSAGNSLVGTKANDQVGSGRITVLSNGNYVVHSDGWGNAGATNAGAVTWGNGTTGTSGEVSADNSLVGTKAYDKVGFGGISVLSNGNYVVISHWWANGSAAYAGAVTWGNGANGSTVGEVSEINSLVGTQTNDYVGFGGITALSNGNYVVRSDFWANGSAAYAAAVTWGNANGSTVGEVSEINSLVGTKAYDQVGTGGITVLSNGNYVVNSYVWDNGSASNAGAVTWGNGITGTSGEVSAANSLVGAQANDKVGFGGITVLSNGNYVVNSYNWANGSASNAGAVTWGNGTTGTSGEVSEINSLVGAQANDQVGTGGITGFANGNYVVNSYNWANGSAISAGAVTWGDGVNGASGEVSAANSLVGTKAYDKVGISGIAVLSNGNYVVNSYAWINGSALNAGAVTWGDGVSGTSGEVSATNSLVGTKAYDEVGRAGTTVLSNGNYVVNSYNWGNGSALNAGAVTWGNGITGTSGEVSAANSLVGTKAFDKVGIGGITVLSNGNYVVNSYNWGNGSALNAGAVTWGNGITGTSGEVSAANSLVGTKANDKVGVGGIAVLSNGNYVVNSHIWANGSATTAGAVTWGNADGSTVGILSEVNSLVGTQANDYVGLGGITVFSNGFYVVRSTQWANAGAVTWGDGVSGTSGEVSAINSLVASTAGAQLNYSSDPSDSLTFLANSTSDGGGGRIYLGLTDINAANNGLTFGRATSQTVTLTSAALESILGAGTDLVLQASNDITVNSAISVDSQAGNGGGLTLQAGRSILVNADIFTDNGNLTLVGNETQANGVIEADRDTGAAMIDLASAFVNAGSGAVNILLADGAGRSNNISGEIKLGSIQAGQLTATHNGPTPNGAISFSGDISTLGGITLGGNLQIANNVVLTATAGSFSWTSEAQDFIEGAGGGETISVHQNGKLVRYGVMDTDDAARLALAQGATSRVYGDTNPDPTGLDLTSGALRGRDTPADILKQSGVDVSWTGGSAPVTNTDVGLYGFTLAANGSFGLNPGKQGYFVSVAPVNGSLTITQRALSVSADNLSRLEGQPDPVLSWTVTSGSLASFDTSAMVFSGGLVRVSGETVGAYAIGQGSLAANANYAMSFLGGVFQITRATTTHDPITQRQVLELPATGMRPIFLPAFSDDRDETANCTDGVFGPDCASFVNPANRHLGPYTSWQEP